MPTAGSLESAFTSGSDGSPWLRQLGLSDPLCRESQQVKPDLRFGKAICVHPRPSAVFQKVQKTSSELFDPSREGVLARYSATSKLARRAIVDAFRRASHSRARRAIVDAFRRASHSLARRAIVDETTGASHSLARRAIVDEATRVVLVHSDKVIGHFVRLGKHSRSGKAVRVEAGVSGCGRFGSLYKSRQKDLSPNEQNDQKPCLRTTHARENAKVACATRVRRSTPGGRILAVGCGISRTPPSPPRENRIVVIRIQDYRHDCERQLAMAGEEFVARFMLHILARRMQRVRFAGLFHPNVRKRRVALCHRLLAGRDEPPAPEGERCIRGVLGRVVA